MGVCVDVESILTLDTYPGVNTSVYKVRTITNQAFLEAICQAMGWENTPWDEPSEKSGFCTSIGNGRYSILLSLAWAIEDLVDDPNGNIPHLIDIVEQTFRSPSEHQ